MIIKTKFKRKSGHVPLFLFTFVGVVGFCITIFSFSEEDSFLYYMMSSHNAQKEAKVWENTLAEYQDLGENEEQYASETSGTGLNLNLINNITTNGYVKELLTLAKESQEGTLTTSEPLVPVELRTVIGIWRSEVDVYSTENYILKSWLPWDSANHCPVWGKAAYGNTAKEMTLVGCGKEQALRLQGADNKRSGLYTAGAIGPFQYKGAPTVASKYNPSTGEVDTNRQNTSSDQYYIPDQIAGLTGYLRAGCEDAGMSEEQIKSLSQDAIAIITAIAHNKGAGAVKNMLLGCYFGSNYNFVDKTKSASDVIASAEEVGKDIAKAVEGLTDYEQMNVYGKNEFIFGYFVLLKAGWYIDAEAYSIIAAKPDLAIASWNILNPSQQVSDWESVSAKIMPYVKTLPEVTGYSAEECDATYNTDNGVLRGFSKSSRGFVFKVTNRTSDAYKSGNHKVVIAFDKVTLEHVVYPCTGAYGLYAVLLRYAGVGVDPTNPETFFNDIKDEEWTPEVPNSLQVLTNYGVDITKLSEGRIKVLEAALNLFGIPYKQCRNFEGCDGFCYNRADARPTHLDCSAYVYRAYMDAGFDVTNFPTRTGSYPGGALVEVPFESAQPGDLMWRAGHVMMYIGTVNDTVYITEASCPGTVIGFSSETLSKAIANHKYYQYVGID